MVENRARPIQLDRGFWTATAVLAVLAIAAGVFWYTFPLETYLPAAIVTARQVDTLFRFMAGMVSNGVGGAFKGYQIRFLHK